MKRVWLQPAWSETQPSVKPPFSASVRSAWNCVSYSVRNVVSVTAVGLTCTCSATGEKWSSAPGAGGEGAALVLLVDLRRLGVGVVALGDRDVEDFAGVVLLGVEAVVQPVLKAGDAADDVVGALELLTIWS